MSGICLRSECDGGAVFGALLAKIEMHTKPVQAAMYARLFAYLK